MNYYRPRTKYDGRLCFTGICLLTGGAPQSLVPGPSWGVLQSLVPRPFWGTPSQDWDPLPDRTGGTPDRGYVPERTGVPFRQDRGYPPPNRRVLAVTLRAVSDSCWTQCWTRLNHWHQEPNPRFEEDLMCRFCVCLFETQHFYLAFLPFIL